MNLDDIWVFLGDFGRYQTLAYILITLAGTWLPAWQIFGIIFTADQPPFHCRATPGFSLAESVPRDGNDSYAECEMYAVIAGSGPGANGSSPVVNSSELVDCTNGFEFQPLYNENTIVMELDLVCDRAILASTAQSILFAGVLAGAFISGQLSDLVGRKTVFLGSLLLQALVGIGLYFVYEYHWFVVMWFFVGMFEQGVNLTEYVLIMEMFSPAKRTIAGCINNVSWGVGVTLLALIAYLLRDWRTMQLAISIPCLVVIPLWFVLYESVRWQLSRGHHKAAFKTLRRIARLNRIDPPSDGFVVTHEGKTIRERPQSDVTVGYRENEEAVGTTIEKRDGEAVEAIKKKAKVYTVIDMLRSWRILKNLVIMCFSWFVNSMVYYGVSLYSSNLAGDKYFNFFLIALVEIPAYVVTAFTMIWWGRRSSLFLFHLLAGIACVVTACLPRDEDEDTNSSTLIVVSAVIGKFFITCSFGVAFLYGTEIFPTPVRNIGFGISSFSGRVGSILAPFIVYLDSVSSYLPLNIFGGLSLLATAFVLFLPETRNKPLPETISEAENLGRRPGRTTTSAETGTDSRGTERGKDPDTDRTNVASVNGVGLCNDGMELGKL